jgi:hypothetical protein
MIEYNNLKIPVDEFDILLNDFAYAVKCNDYEKMPYKTWKALTSFPLNAKISINHSNQSSTISIWIDEKIYNFDTNDNSFGSFLEDELSNPDWINYMKEQEETLWKAAVDENRTIATLKTDICESPYITNYTNYDGTMLACSSSIVDSYSNTYPTINFELSTKANKSDLDILEQKVQKVLDKYENNNDNTKENKNMKTFNFDFGPMNGNVVRMSMYGLAVRDKTGAYVSYDAKAGEIMNVDILNFDGANFLYKMPVAIKDITVGDVVIHQNVPMFVVDMSAPNKTLTVVDPVLGERKEIMLARSPFGFNFATKVVNFLGNAFDTAASAENPFGNMWMLLAMSEDADMSSILPMMMFAQGGAADPSMAMVMMAMSQKNGKMDMASMLPMMWMMNNNKPAATCHCGCHKDGE